MKSYAHDDSIYHGPFISIDLDSLQLYSVAADFFKKSFQLDIASLRDIDHLTPDLRFPRRERNT